MPDSKSFPCLHQSQCDLHLPFCKTCFHSGRTCEGYAHRLASLNRSRQGNAKRQAFQEAKRPRDTLSWSASSTVSFAAPTIAQQRKTPCHQTTIFDGMSLQPQIITACEAQLVSTFWEHYIPQKSVQTRCECPWLQQALDLPTPAPALRLALKAVAMARLGWTHRDNTLTLNGRIVYGRALHEMQKALYDERTMWQDQTLATGNILALYEVGHSS